MRPLLKKIQKTSARQAEGTMKACRHAHQWTHGDTDGTARCHGVFAATLKSCRPWHTSITCCQSSHHLLASHDATRSQQVAMLYVLRQQGNQSGCTRHTLPAVHQPP
jgi:hypothetical protein